MKVALIDNARLLGAIVAAQLVELGHRVDRVTPGEAFRVLLRRHTTWSAFVVAVDAARLPPVLRLLRCADRDAPIVAVVGKGLILPDQTIADARRLTLLHPPIDREVLGAALAANANRSDSGDTRDFRIPRSIAGHRRARAARDTLPTSPRAAGERPPDDGGRPT